MRKPRLKINGERLVSVYTHRRANGGLEFLAYLAYQTDLACLHWVMADSGPHAKAAAIKEHARECVHRGAWRPTHPDGHVGGGRCTCAPTFVPPVRQALEGKDA